MMKFTESQITCPDIFVEGKIHDNEKKICSDALIGWGLCRIGKVPPNFGSVMAQIAGKLSIPATEKGITSYCQEKGWLTPDKV